MRLKQMQTFNNFWSLKPKVILNIVDCLYISWYTTWFLTETKHD